MLRFLSIIISSLFLFTTTPVDAGRIHGKSQHNGFKGQMGLNIPGQSGSGDFLCLNVVFCGQGWVYSNNSGRVPPDEVDAQGWPTSISNGGYKTRIYWPSQSERPGNYVITWTGNGTIYLNASYSLVSGSLTSTLGSGRAVIEPAAGSSPAVGDIGVSSMSSQIRDIKMFHVDDENNINAGRVFGTKFLNTLQEAGVGVIRFMDYMGGNISQLTTWDSRRRADYAFLFHPEVRPAIYAGLSSTTGACSTDNYCVTFGSGPPQHNQTIQVKWNESASSTNLTLNLNNTGAVPILQASSAAITTNSRPVINLISTLIYNQPLNAWLKTGGDVNSGGDGFLVNGFAPEYILQLALEVGAHPWVNSGFLTAVPLSDFTPSLASFLKDNAPAWMIPRFELSNEVWNTLFQAYTYANSVQLIVNGGSTPRTDVTAYSYNGTSSTITFTAPHGFSVGSRVTLTNFDGTLAPSPNNRTPYVTSVPSTTQIVVNYSPSSGTWSSTGTVAGTTNDYHNWYGEGVSQTCEAVSIVYGGDRSKYECIVAVQTGTTPASSDPRLGSYSYVLRGGTPASDWVTVFSLANYVAASDYSTNNALLLGFDYWAGAPEAMLSYLATLEGSPSGINIPQFMIRAAAWDAWRTSFGIAKQMPYEGGYSPDYGSAATTGSVSAATNATSAVVTIPTTLITAAFTVTVSNSGPAARVGMMLGFSGTTGMTQLNTVTAQTVTFSNGSPNITRTAHGLIVNQGVIFTQGASGVLPPELTYGDRTGSMYHVVSVPDANTFTISATKGGSAITMSSAGSGTNGITSGWFVTNIAGNDVTLDVDSSAWGTFGGTVTATYINGNYYINNLRFQSKFAPILGYYMGLLFTQLEAADTENISHYFMVGASKTSTGAFNTNAQAWGMFDPNVYCCPSTALGAYQQYSKN